MFMEGIRVQTPRLNVRLADTVLEGFSMHAAPSVDWRSGEVRMPDDQIAVNYTERMVPEEAHARTFWEHVARYRFAKNFVR